MKKHFAFGFGVLAILLTLAGCRQPSSGEVPIVTGVTVEIVEEMIEEIAEDPDRLSRVAVRTLSRGLSVELRAIVEGRNQPPQTVNWYIVEAGRNGGTRIGSDGVLHVSANESLATITVGARSTFDTRRFGRISFDIEGGQIVDDGRLERPRITLVGSVLRWEEVPGAGGYSLRVGGVEVVGGSLGRNARRFDLADLPLALGDHIVTLVALGIPGQRYDSPPSDPVVFSVTGVAQPGLPQLPAPVISLTGSMLTWVAVPGAGGYSLRVGGLEVPGGDLGPGKVSFDLWALGLPTGNHVVTLVALGVPGRNLNSPPSNPVIFTVPSIARPGLPQLAAPEITLTNSTLSWTPVPGAGGYSLRVGGLEVPGGNLGPGVTGFDLSSLGLPVGDHSVTLVALGVPGQSLNSPISNQVTYTVTYERPGLPRLPAPTISIDGAIVSWDGVPGAGGYSLRVGGVERALLGHTERDFNLAGLGLPVGIHSVTLVALGVSGQSLNSPASNAVIFYVIVATGVTVRVVVPDLRDMAEGIDIQVPSFGLLDTPGRIVFDSQHHDVDGVEWLLGETRVSGTVDGTLYILTLDSAIHGNRDGPHFVTLEVIIGGMPYSRVIAFTVGL